MRRIAIVTLCLLCGCIGYQNKTRAYVYTPMGEKSYRNVEVTQLHAGRIQFWANGRIVFIQGDAIIEIEREGD